MTVLWRFAEQDGPYFGPRSFWTPDRPFAERFGLWALEHPGHPLCAGDAALYRLDADLAGKDTWTFEVVFSDSTSVLKVCDRLAQVGIRWVTFKERPFEGKSATQVIYLGREVLCPAIVSTS